MLIVECWLQFVVCRVQIAGTNVNIIMWVMLDVKLYNTIPIKRQDIFIEINPALECVQIKINTNQTLLNIFNASICSAKSGRNIYSIFITV